MKLFIFSLLLSSTTLAYEFHSGSKTYSTAKTSDQISAEYGFKFDTKPIVIAASHIKNQHYSKQWEILDLLDAESLQLIYITAISGSLQKSGYFIGKETAKTILNGSNFRILMFSYEGNEILNSSDVVSATEIKRLLKDKFSLNPNK